MSPIIIIERSLGPSPLNEVERLRKVNGKLLKVLKSLANAHPEGDHFESALFEAKCLISELECEAGLTT